MSGFYDLDELKAIPIADVCRALGLEEDRRLKGKYKAFGERTGSLHLYNTGGQNRFCDFGRNVSGDTIGLVAYIQNLSYKDAIGELASMFGIESIRQNSYEDSKELSNWEWGKIGIYGDVAMKNMEFSFNRPDSMERNMELAMKYRMSMNELRKEHPSTYKSILYKRGSSYVYALRQEYYNRMYLTREFMKSGGYQDFSKLPDSSYEELKEYATDLTNSERILKNALEGTGLHYPFTSYDVNSDWKKVLNGTLVVEFGSKTAYDMKRYAQNMRVSVVTREYDVDVVDRLQVEHRLSFPFAAKRKGNMVQVSVEKKYIGVFEEAQRQAEKKCMKGKSLEEKIQNATSVKESAQASEVHGRQVGPEGR